MTYSKSESGVGGGEIDDVEFWRYRLAYSEGDSGVGGGDIDDVDAVGFKVSNQFFWSSVLLPEVSKSALLSRGVAGSVADSDCPVRDSIGIPSLVGPALINILSSLLPMQGVVAFMFRLSWCRVPE